MKLFINYLCLIIVLLFAPNLTLAAASPSATNFLVLSDIHVDHIDWLPMTINPSIQNPLNDLDQTSFETMLLTINDNIKNGLVPKPDFILILGDIAAHSRFIPNSVIKNEAIVFNKLKTTFAGTPIFYIFGNNDSLQANYGVFHHTNHNGNDKSPYDVAKSYGGWLDGFLSTGTYCQAQQNIYPCLITTNTTQGYYATYLDHKLRMIALNSVLFAKKHVQTTEYEANEQLQWLRAQLESATINKESVLIVMHIPPGNNVYDDSNFWLPQAQEDFLKIIEMYPQTIIGLLASHTHAEELKIIKTTDNRIITGLYFTPSLSTSHGNAPAVKTFHLSKTQGRWQLANYETFNFLQIDTKLKLNKLYDYQSYYCKHRETNIAACLDQVTADKMNKYFSAGNPNFDGVINTPDDINLFIYQNDK